MSNHPLLSYREGNPVREWTLCHPPKERTLSVFLHCPLPSRTGVTLKCAHHIPQRMNPVSTCYTLQSQKMIYVHTPIFLETQQDSFMNRTPSPHPVPREGSGNHTRLPLFLPSPSPISHDFGIRRLVGLLQPAASSAVPKGPASPPVLQKESFGICSRLPQVAPSVSVSKKQDFGIRAGLPPSPLPPVSNDFGIRSRIPPSTPVPKNDFGLRSGLPCSPLLPVPKQNYGPREAVFKPQAPREALRSPSLHAEDFGVSVPEEGPSQIGNLQPTEAGEPLGSSSKPRSEFHILTFMRILLIYVEPGDGENVTAGCDETLTQSKYLRVKQSHGFPW